MPAEERRQTAYKWENYFCVILEIEKGVMLFNK
jgi:hypothetical protein